MSTSPRLRPDREANGVIGLADKKQRRSPTVKFRQQGAFSADTFHASNAGVSMSGTQNETLPGVERFAGRSGSPCRFKHALPDTLHSRGSVHGVRVHRSAERACRRTLLRRRMASTWCLEGIAVRVHLRRPDATRVHTRPDGVAAALRHGHGVAGDAGVDRRHAWPTCALPRAAVVWLVTLDRLARWRRPGERTGPHRVLVPRKDLYVRCAHHASACAGRLEDCPPSLADLNSRGLVHRVGLCRLLRPSC